MSVGDQLSPMTPSTAGSKPPGFVDDSTLVGGRLFLTAGANIVLALLGVLTGVATARLLGPEGRGQLAAIQTWPTFIATMAMLGLTEALVYYCARERRSAGAYLGSAMAFVLIVAVPAMMIGYISLPTLLRAQSDHVVRAARWYLCLIPLFGLVAMPYHPFQGLNDFRVWNCLRIMAALGWLAVVALAWLAEQNSPEFLAGGYLVFLALLSLPVLWITARRVPGPFWPEVAKCQRLLRYGVPCLASSMPQFLNVRLDQMLMAAFLPAELLGFYVVAVAWSGAAHPLLGALGKVLVPHVASRSHPEEQVRAFGEGVRLGGVLATSIAGILIGLTYWAVPFLFGQAFRAAVPAALILVVAASIASLNSVVEEGLRGLGRPTAVISGEFGGLLVTAACLIALLRPFNIVGAALSALLGYVTITILLLLQARRITGRTVRWLLLPTPSEVQAICVRMGIKGSAGYAFRS